MVERRKGTMRGTMIGTGTPIGIIETETEKEEIETGMKTGIDIPKGTATRITENGRTEIEIETTKRGKRRRNTRGTGLDPENEGLIVIDCLKWNWRYNRL